MKGNLGHEEIKTCCEDSVVKVVVVKIVENHPKGFERRNDCQIFFYFHSVLFFKGLNCGK